MRLSEKINGSLSSLYDNNFKRILNESEELKESESIKEAILRDNKLYLSDKLDDEDTLVLSGTDDYGLPWYESVFYCGEVGTGKELYEVLRGSFTEQEVKEDFPIIFNINQDLTYALIGSTSNYALNDMSLYKVKTTRKVEENSRKHELTEGTNQKRIARYKEFDNGHVLHSWYEMSDDEAEEKAKQASINDPTDIYYVAYDDIMNSSSDIRWYKGKPYSIDEVNEIRKKEKENIEIKESESPDKQTILSRIFARYPDISEEDEDYLNSLPLDGLINEVYNRGWDDLLDEE